MTAVSTRYRMACRICESDRMESASLLNTSVVLFRLSPVATISVGSSLSDWAVAALSGSAMSISPLRSASTMEDSSAKYRRVICEEAGACPQ